MAKAKCLCWNCKFSRYYDHLHIECVNPKVHFNSPLIHRDSEIDCEFYKPKTKKRRVKKCG